MKTRSLKFSNNRPQVPEKKHENHFISFDFIHNELNVPMQCTQYATKVHDKTMQPMWSSCYGKNGNSAATKFLRRLHWNSMLPKDEIDLSQTSVLTLSKMPVPSTRFALMTQIPLPDWTNRSIRIDRASLTSHATIHNPPSRPENLAYSEIRWLQLSYYFKTLQRLPRLNLCIES